MQNAVVNSDDHGNGVRVSAAAVARRASYKFNFSAFGRYLLFARFDALTEKPVSSVENAIV
jgi:hypothetical protein